MLRFSGGFGLTSGEFMLGAQLFFRNLPQPDILFGGGGLGAALLTFERFTHPSLTFGH